MSNLMSRLYKQSLVEERLQTLEPQLQRMASSSGYVQYEYMLQGQLQRLEDRARTLFSMLNINKGTIEECNNELNKRLKKFNTQVLNLSGQNLYQSVIGKIDILRDKEIKQEQKDYVKAVNTWINTTVGKDVLSKNLDTEEIFLQMIAPYGRWANNNKISVESKEKWITERKGGFKSQSQLVGVSNLTDILVHNLTKSKKDALANFEEDMKNQKGSKKSSLQNITITKQNNDSIDITGVWEKAYKKDITPTYAQQNWSAKQLADYQNQIIKSITAMAPSANLEPLITHMLRQDPYAFCVGKNTNNIIGRLGELQGLYYMRILLSDSNNSSMPPNLSWEGGVKKAGKDPHADLMLGGFGIQVKNTTKSNIEAKGLNNISFTKLSIQNFIDRCRSNGLNISSYDELVLNSFFGTYAFNIQYNEQFASTREKMEAMMDYTDTLFAIMMASLMYMDADKKAVGYDGNVLYLLGASSAITAYQILKDMYNELLSVHNEFSSLTHSPLKVRSSIGSGGENIYTAISHKKNLRKNESMDDMLNSVILTTTYNFKSKLFR